MRVSYDPRLCMDAGLSQTSSPVGSHIANIASGVADGISTEISSEVGSRQSGKGASAHTSSQNLSHPTLKRAVLPLVLLVLANLLSACAHFDQRAPTITQAQEQAIIKEAPPPANDLSDNGSDLNAIPLDVNRLVLQWIDYFQGRGRPHMERYLSRLTRYAPAMKEILHKQGLPEDLIYIALIESGFSSTAHSSASAVGYWQFIRGTGHRYGLQIDSYVDERRDFVRSTEAAADYFKGLYNLFGAWYLAIASYNVGENRVKNVVMKYHTRDFWQLARENKLPEETVNYVPKFLAARLIAREPEKYGFSDIEYMPALEYANVDFDSSIDLRKLATAMNIDYDDLRDLNPSYKRGVAFSKSGSKLTLRVPKGQEALAVAAAVSASADNRRVYVASEDWSYYRVRRGDTISVIAHKFGTTQSVLRDLNSMTSRSQLVAGKRIRVPAETVGGLSRETAHERRRSSKEVALSKKNISQHQKIVAKRIHIVRRGDTLTEIAKRYRVSIRALTRTNELGHHARISVGSHLEIP